MCTIQRTMWVAHSMRQLTHTHTHIHTDVHAHAPTHAHPHMHTHPCMPTTPPTHHVSCPGTPAPPPAGPSPCGSAGPERERWLGGRGAPSAPHGGGTGLTPPPPETYNEKSEWGRNTTHHRAALTNPSGEQSKKDIKTDNGTTSPHTH